MAFILPLRSAFRAPIWRQTSFGARCLSSSALRLSGQTEQPILHTPTKRDPNTKPMTSLEIARAKFKPEELEAARVARETLIKNTPLYRVLPEKWIPYAELMRLEKPGGTHLLLIPSLWGITMAAYSVHAPLTTTLSAIALFSIGAVIMRGAGCTINDIWDRDLDNQVARTMERPITSGRVSVNQAVGFLAAECFAGLAVLLSLPFECFYLGALSLPFVFTYPLFKRFTYYPQIMLSITFSWGCLLGFPAVHAPLNLWVAVPLFLSKFFWSMSYDTVYAHQDKMYDIKAGIKSTALKWQDKSRSIIYGMTAVQASLYGFAGFMNHMGPGFFLFGAYGMTRMFLKLRKVNLDNPDDCWKFFNDNIRTGYILWFGIVVDYVLQLLGYL